MKRRVAVTGGVIVGLALLLGWLWKGFLGPGGGDGEGTGDRSQVQVQAPESAATQSQAGQSKVTAISDRTETDPGGGSSQGVVDVVIDGETYLIKQPAGQKPEYAPIALDALVQKVREAEGNKSGVRVRLSRRGTSIPVAEEKLEQALLKADIPRHAIYWLEERAP